MNDNDSFVKDFFSRPDTDDTVENLKKEYYESKRKIDNLSKSTSPQHSEKEYSSVFRSPPKIPTFKSNGGSESKQNNLLRQQLRGMGPIQGSSASRASPTAPPSSNKDDVLVLINELKQLRETVYHQQTQIQSLKFEVQQERSRSLRFEGKLNQLETAIQVQQQQIRFTEFRPHTSATATTATSAFSNNEEDWLANDRSYLRNGGTKVTNDLRFNNNSLNRPNNVFESRYSPMGANNIFSEKISHSSPYNVPPSFIHDESTTNLLKISAQK